MRPPRGTERTVPKKECWLLISGLMFGGGQRVVLDLCSSSSPDVVPRIVLLGRATGELAGSCAEVIPYDGRYNRARTLLGAARKLRSSMKRKRPFLLHTHGWDADTIGSLACRGLDTRQIVHLHTTPDWIRSSRLKHVVRRWVSCRTLSSDTVRVVAVSQAVRAHWSTHLGLNPALIGVIHNGVDVERYRPAGTEREESPTPLIGVAARMAPMKGIEYLVEALTALRGRGTAFRVDIAGSGAGRKRLEELMRQSSIRADVRFLGQVDDMSEFYRRLDIYVLPSVSTEGLPLTVLEAMASGLPVLATTVGDTPEAVREGTDGFLVPPRDAGALAEKLELLVGDAQLRTTLGQNARRRATELFSLDRFTREVLALYQ